LKKLISIILLLTLITLAAESFGSGSSQIQVDQNELKQILENKSEGVTQMVVQDELDFEWTPDPGVRVKDGGVPFVHKMDDGRYRLYYCGQGGIISAVSHDGLDFEKDAGERIGPGSLGSGEAIVCDASIIHLPNGWVRMYYKGANGPGGPGQAVHSIYSAISPDGLNFQREGVRIDSIKSEDDGWASVPEAIRLLDDRIRIYYVSDSQYVGHGIVSAISSDGLNFQKEDTKLTGFVDPAVMLLPDGRFLMLAVAFPTMPGSPGSSGLQPGIYSLISEDGIEFHNGQPVLLQEGALDPSIVAIGNDSYRVYYGDMRNQEIKSLTFRLK
jgi:hypothetical protein